MCAKARYPPWGFKTSLWARSRPQSTNSLSPWGFKTPQAHNAYTPLFPVVSLSPMGIQNADGTLRGVAGYRLTIPHEDSKLRPRNGVAIQLVLTIPHGDSKHPAWNRPRWTELPHYPPWGFKTLNWPLQPCPWLFSHYPPWGFKTLWLPVPTLSVPTSLSPMGIQNATEIPVLPDTSELTIPHGDSKQPGTSTRGARRGCLTIPHGDSKPIRCESETAPTAPHYPPWGFKTSLQCLHPVGCCINSLSPMGIQNADGLVGAAAALGISLSPMGIQNNQVPHRRTGHARLTIPHGDSKLGAGEYEGRHLGLLTIPHGDSKLYQNIGGRNSLYPSLSPMGIQNRPYIPCIGIVQPASHYPPWGFKTPLSRRPRQCPIDSQSPMGIQNTTWPVAP